MQEATEKCWQRWTTPIGGKKKPPMRNITRRVTRRNSYGSTNGLYQVSKTNMMKKTILKNRKTARVT